MAADTPSSELWLMGAGFDERTALTAAPGALLANTFVYVSARFGAAAPLSENAVKDSDCKTVDCGATCFNNVRSEADAA
eukprot:2065875-Amphidinium_carterae.1